MHGLDNYGIGVEVLEFTGEDVLIDAYIMNTYYIYLLLGWVDVCGKFPPPEKKAKAGGVWSP